MQEDENSPENEKMQEIEVEYNKYKGETEKNVKLLWQKINDFENQIYVATRLLSKYFFK